MVYGYCFIARSLWFIYQQFYMHGFFFYIYIPCLECYGYFLVRYGLFITVYMHAFF